MRDECDNELVGCRMNMSSSPSTHYVLSVMFLLFYALCNYNEVNVVHTFRKRRKGLKTPRKRTQVLLFNMFSFHSSNCDFFYFYFSVLFIASMLCAFILFCIFPYYIHVHSIRTEKEHGEE